MYQHYIKYVSLLCDTKKYRTLPKTYQTKPNDYLDFSSNDYLGLAHHPELLEAAITAAKKYGIGATGSRVLSGNNELFENLEDKIAQDKHTETALIFNSGFQTNISVLSALLDQKVLGVTPLVFFDKLNHASLYQAVFLSNAELVRYQHNNMEHLSTLLDTYKNDNRPKFIVTETIFGMDGDIVPINELLSLALQHQTFLYLDEAHATGIIGVHGYGLSTTIDLTGIPNLIMGTFSKALGCSGGYIACSKNLKDYLINKATGFIYATANSPMTLGAASKAWDMIKTFDIKRTELFSLSHELKSKLIQLGFTIGPTSSHIIPIILNTEEQALQANSILFQHNIMASCIRPPTVPPNTSRIRIALTTGHNKHDIDQLLYVLKML